MKRLRSMWIALSLVLCLSVIPAEASILIVMDEKIQELVDRRWDSYGLGDFLSSPTKKARS